MTLPESTRSLTEHGWLEFRWEYLRDQATVCLKATLTPACGRPLHHFRELTERLLVLCDDVDRVAAEAEQDATRLLVRAAEGRYDVGWYVQTPRGRGRIVAADWSDEVHEYEVEFDNDSTDWFTGYEVELA